MVAGSVLVPSSPRVGGGRAKGVASIPQPANEQRPSTRPPQQLAHSDCVEVIRQCFQDKGLSGSVFTLLLGANRATSKSSYSPHGMVRLIGVLNGISFSGLMI